MIVSRARFKKETGYSAVPEQPTREGSLPLASVFTRECIEALQPTASKAEAIRSLVQSLVYHQRLSQPQADVITDQLIQHEDYGSSAIGKGLAFPHLRTHEVQSFMGVIGVAPEGIHFHSLDGKPTKLVFLLLSPLVSRDEHMNLLSRLVSLIRDQVACIQLHHMYQPEDIFRYLHDLDEHSDAVVKSSVSILGNETDD